RPVVETNRGQRLIEAGLAGFNGVGRNASLRGDSGHGQQRVDPMFIGSRRHRARQPPLILLAFKHHGLHAAAGVDFDAMNVRRRGVGQGLGRGRRLRLAEPEQAAEQDHGGGERDVDLRAACHEPCYRRRRTIQRPMPANSSASGSRITNTYHSERAVDGASCSDESGATLTSTAICASRRASHWNSAMPSMRLPSVSMNSLVMKSLSAMTATRWPASSDERSASPVAASRVIVTPIVSGPLRSPWSGWKVSVPRFSSSVSSQLWVALRKMVSASHASLFRAVSAPASGNSVRRLMCSVMGESGYVLTSAIAGWPRPSWR